MTSLADPAAIALAREALLVDGALRVGLNLSNILLVHPPCGADHAGGVAPTLARRLAAALGVPIKFVCYDTPGQVIADAPSGIWSVAFLGADPLRSGEAVFSQPYVGIEATYLVPRSSPFMEAAQVDAPGARIALFKGSAYDLWLRQHLRHAQLVHADTAEQAVQKFHHDGLDALAGLRAQLDPLAVSQPQMRVLKDNFTTVQQAVALPIERAGALPYLDAFLKQEKQSGGLAALIERLAPPGLRILDDTPPDPHRETETPS